jgi:hypothetical protein
MAKARDEREQELRTIAVADYIRLVKIYQDAIGTPRGQIPIPGVLLGRMIEAILTKEFPLTSKSLA